MENLKWIKLNKQGFIPDNYKNILSNDAGIYAYRLISDKTKIYIGSAQNLSQRFRQHRYRYSIYKGNNSKFYNMINKYGWNNIEYTILEILKSISNAKIEKNILMEKEQWYLDKYSPSLNINKKAGSMAGYKHSDIIKLKFGDMHRAKSYKRLYKTNIKCLVSDETKNKLRLRSRGAPVLVYDKNLNLVKSFQTIKETGVFVGLSPSSVSKYINEGTIWNNKYYFKLK